MFKFKYHRKLKKIATVAMLNAVGNKNSMRSFGFEPYYKYKCVPNITIKLKIFRIQLLMLRILRNQKWKYLKTTKGLIFYDQSLLV